MESKPSTIRIKACHSEKIPAGGVNPVDESAGKRALELATVKANSSADKVAASLGLRVLGIYSRSESLGEETPAGPGDSAATDRDGRRTLKACVDIEYRVSAYHQAQADLMVLRASNDLFHLIKKELSTRWFQYKFSLLARFSRKEHVDPSAARPERALVVGHFSVPGGGGTFGDLEAEQVVCEWLSEAQIKFDVASNLEDGIDGLKLDQIDEREYGIFIFVCGPWYPQRSIPAMLLKKFAHCLKIGVNLTTQQAGNAGFDYLLARDSQEEVHADISFAKKVDLLPVVAVILVERQVAYGSRQRHLYVRNIIDEYLERGEVVPLWLDTVANHNKTKLKTSQQFESLVRKADLVITNRLHGLVLSLKNSVPVVLIDAVAGGGKVSDQAKALGWPVLIPAEELTIDRLSETVRACLQADLKADIQKSQSLAAGSIADKKQQFMNILSGRGGSDSAGEQKR